MLYDDYEGCARLARDVKTPLTIGENIYGPRECFKAQPSRATPAPDHPHNLLCSRRSELGLQIS